MSVDTNQLLRSLGSGIRPSGPDPARPPSGAAGSADVVNGSFADLLQAAASGSMSSGAPVKIAKGVKLELTPAQLSRAAVAADRAQAQGADRAVILMDGKALELDVATRTITGEVKGAPGGKLPRVLDGVGTIIAVPAEGEAAEQASPLSGLSGVANSSLLSMLSSREESSRASDPLVA